MRRYPTFSAPEHESAPKSTNPAERSPSCTIGARRGGLSVTIKAKLYDQFRRPRGPLGILAGRVLATPA
jgi:hypothetical protein